MYMYLYNKVQLPKAKHKINSHTCDERVVQILQVIMGSFLMHACHMHMIIFTQ